METKFATQLIHFGDEKARAHRAVGSPIYRASTFEMGGEKIYDEILYGRMNNSPAHKALHAKLAKLEGTEDALTFASGMSAITSAIMALVNPGDHMILQSCVYGGTYGFLTDEAERLGIEISWVDIDNLNEVKSAIKPNTKWLYIESISNPLLQVPDFEAVVSFAKENNLQTMIDSTFVSPAVFRPADHGIDVVLHSATKYLNGHSDVLAGAVMSSAANIKKMKTKLAHYGGCLDPQAVYLLNRGIATLDVRMDRHGQNALEVAKFLANHPKVKEVHYPGLEGNSYYDRAKKYFRNSSGVMSFIADSVEEAARVVDQLEYFAHAPSLGGVESLVVIPANSSHAGQSEEELQKIGLSRALVRLSVGLEDPKDLIADLQKALG